MLTYRGHDVIVIEQDPARHRIIEDNLDVQAVCADGTSPAVLQDCQVARADILIAVTENDEMNILATLFAKRMGARRTVARIRNPEYLYLTDKGLEKALPLDFLDAVINPDYVTATAVAELIEVPEALESEFYAGGRIQLLQLRLPAHSPAINKRLRELPSPNPYLIVAVQRKDKIIIPRGDDYLLAEDRIFVIAPSRQMEHVEHLLGQERLRVQRVVILGGTRAAYYLARMLEDKKIELKIIEKDPRQCEVLSERLPNAMIIQGDGSDISLLKEEDIGRADVFAALTGDDKANLLVSLLAKHLGAKKVITKVGRSDYAGLMEEVGVDVAISPRLLTAAAILKMVMGGEIVALSLVGEDKAEMFELIVPRGFRAAGKPLKQVNFPRQAVIGAIARDKEVIVPGGNDAVMPGDHVIVFALPKAVASVQHFFGSNE